MADTENSNDVVDVDVDSALDSWLNDEATQAEAKGNQEQAGKDSAKAGGSSDSGAADSKEAETKKETQESHPSLARALKKLAEREAELDQLKKSYETTKKAGDATKNVGSGPVTMTDFQRDPAMALQKLGFDENQAATVLRAGLATIMGDKAPDSYKGLLRDQKLEARFAESQSELQKLRDELQTERRQSAEKAYVEQYRTQVSTYLGGENEVPLVSKLYAQNRDECVGNIMQIVMADAGAKIRAGQNDAMPLSEREAAKILESKLEKLKSVFVENAQKASTASAKPNLSNKDTRPSGQTKQPEDEELPVDKMVDIYLQRMWGGAS